MRAFLEEKMLFASLHLMDEACPEHKRIAEPCQKNFGIDFDLPLNSKNLIADHLCHKLF